MPSKTISSVDGVPAAARRWTTAARIADLGAKSRRTLNDWAPPGPLRMTVPEVPVQAAANFSLGYGKQVIMGVIAAARKWQDDDASAMAAGVAYYLALSLFPMLILLTAGLGLVFRFTSIGHDAELQILAVVAEHGSETLGNQVEEVLSQMREHSLVSGPLGLFTAVLAAIGVFYQFERAFDRIWCYKARQDANWWAACKRIVRQRLSAFCLLGCVGLAIVLVMLVNLVVGFVQDWMIRLRIPGSSFISALDACMTLILNAVVFGLLYRWLPKRKIQWSDALRGGLLAAVVWEVGRQLLGAVLIGVRYTTAYGAIGSFIAMLLWCYWGVSIVFFGAEYAQVLYDDRRSRKEAADPRDRAALAAAPTDVSEAQSPESISKPTSHASPRSTSPSSASIAA
ncbi:MAG: YihY/virulence factor BrkB family protein [Pirellulaceae bacterium]|nr:YihY/virulence factor BrkB family protein [Pirellulaceae bacterium]